MYLIFFICGLMLVSQALFCQPNTVAVAVSEKFFRSTNALRNKSQAFLQAMQVRCNKVLQKLKNQKRATMAETLSNNFDDLYDSLESDFDEVFLGIDKEFIATGTLLDKRDASIKEKRAFVQELSRKLNKSIENLIALNTEYYDNLLRNY